MNNELILWEVDHTKLRYRVLWVAANHHNFKQIFNYLDNREMLYFYDFEAGLAEFFDIEEKTRFSLIEDKHNIFRVGRVHELYVDSDCEIYAATQLYFPLCNLPGAKKPIIVEVDKLTLPYKLIFPRPTK